jgi:phosphate transport system substrate-binding protein
MVRLGAAMLAGATLACAHAGAHAQATRAVDAALPAWTPQAVGIDPAAPYLSADGAVRIGGAEHVQFIVDRFNSLFQQRHPGIRFAVDGKGTSSAVPLLTHGKTLFGAMGRAINPIEAVPYRKIVGRDALGIVIAHTAGDPGTHLATSLAVYVNRANPLTQISMLQLAKVLAIGNPGGDYSRWGQLGLPGEWKARAIHPYGTPEYTGFGDYLQEAHLGNRALAPSHEALGNGEAILQRIAQDPDGIGVAAIGLENAQLRQLAIVGADGRSVTRGTAAEVGAGSYPLGRKVYFYVRKLPGQPVDPLVREYLRMVLSREGQAIVASQAGGYIPLSASQAAAELARLDAND